MFLGQYQLAEQPFGVTPDPRYFYLSPTHREAMASVLYGVTLNRGFSTMIASPGMGKTTILFDLLRKLKSTHRTVFLFQTQCGPRGLLRALLADLGISDDGKDFQRMNAKLNEFLLRESAEGRRLVVVVDEAQNLGEPVLEVLRTLSNFETTREKLMHVILSGQPQLAEKLSSQGLVQLRQRISIVAKLQPFPAEETRKYIEHRLGVAGCENPSRVFSNKAINLIARHSEGIPRTINNLCFNAMSLGSAMKRPQIDEQILLEVLNDLDLRQLAPGGQPQRLEAAPARLLPSPAGFDAAREKASGGNVQGVPKKWLVAAVVGALIWPAIQIGASVRHKWAALPAQDAVATQPARELVEESQRALQAPTPGAPNAEPMPMAPVSASTVSRVEVSGPVTIDAPSDWEEVQVARNQTLSELCVSRYGKYDSNVIREIVARNPRLTNPDHIQSGQILQLPVVPDSAVQNSIVSSGNNKSNAQEVEQR